MKLSYDSEWGAYTIEDLTREDVQSLYRMIKSANLLERRDFNSLKTQIEQTINM